MKINDFGLINATGEEWKELRAGVSPIFSLSKMKNMTKAIDDVRKNSVWIYNIWSNNEWKFRSN